MAQKQQLQQRRQNHCYQYRPIVAADPPLEMSQLQALIHTKFIAEECFVISYETHMSDAAAGGSFLGSTWSARRTAVAPVEKRFDHIDDDETARLNRILSSPAGFGVTAWSGSALVPTPCAVYTLPVCVCVCVSLCVAFALAGAGWTGDRRL